MAGVPVAHGAAVRKALSLDQQKRDSQASQTAAAPGGEADGMFLPHHPEVVPPANPPSLPPTGLSSWPSDLGTEHAVGFPGRAARCGARLGPLSAPRPCGAAGADGWEHPKSFPSFLQPIAHPGRATGSRQIHSQQPLSDERWGLSSWHLPTHCVFIRHLLCAGGW